MMLKRENEQAEAMSEAGRPNKLKLVDHDDATYVKYASFVIKDLY